MKTAIPTAAAHQTTGVAEPHTHNVVLVTFEFRLFFTGFRIPNEQPALFTTHRQGVPARTPSQRCHTGWMRQRFSQGAAVDFSDLHVLQAFTKTRYPIGLRAKADDSVRVRDAESGQGLEWTQPEPVDHSVLTGCDKLLGIGTEIRGRPIGLVSNNLAFALGVPNDADSR